MANKKPSKKKPTKNDKLLEEYRKQQKKENKT